MVFSSGFALLLSLLLLIVMGAFGIVVLRRIAPFLRMLELIAYGIPLGVVAASLLLLALAWFVGLHAFLVVIVGVTCVVATLLFWPPDVSLRAVWQGVMPRSQATSGIVAGSVPQLSFRWPLVPVIVLGGFALRWAVMWSSAFTVNETGLWAGMVSIWGDWALHLGDVSSFVYGNNFPPRNIRWAGGPLAYHYLPSITSAAMVKLGMTPTAAMSLMSFLFSLLVALSAFCFTQRFVANRNTAALTVFLFLLGGGLNWVMTAAEINNSHDVVGTLLRHPWEANQHEAANFRWHNMYMSLIGPQRGYLYGMPLGLLILTMLFVAVQGQELRLFAVAGVIAGLLPFAHLSTLLALALMTPFLFLLFPSRGWFLFFALWVVIAVPQLYIQQGGERGATSGIRMQLGWVASPDAWPWFWLKNLGWFLPLLGFAFADRTLMPPVARRFLWGFMSIFVLTNVMAFQPWDWDNIKFMLYWFLAVCILVSALIVKLWNQHRSPVVRMLLVGVVLSMILSGVLINLNQLLGNDRHLMLTPEELQLASAIREQTPTDAVFVAGMQHNHPVTVMTGRQVVIGYTGVLWAQGVDYSERERDVRTIYTFAPDTEQLLAKYAVDYVVIGPNERDQLGANVEAFRQRYQRLIATDNYEVYAVSPQ